MNGNEIEKCSLIFIVIYTFHRTDNEKYKYTLKLFLKPLFKLQNTE